MLRHLPQHRHGDKTWKNAIKHCRQLYDNVGLVYCQQQAIPANSEITLDGRAKVTVANFDRTVMCMPVNNIINQKLKLEPIITSIPANQNVARFPVRIKNFTENDINLISKFPVYKITSPDQIFTTKCLSKREEELLSAFDLPDIKNEYLDALKQLIIDNNDVFALSDEELGCCDITEHKIIVDDPTPFKEKYRRIPPSMYADVKEQLESMLKCGVIRESNSPYSSPVTIVAKKDGRARICCDFRTLNKRTKKDAKSLPRIDETLDMLRGATIYSNLDLMSGYWQTKLSEESKELTAFTAGPLGFYEWNRLPFGLCNSGATFQRMIEKALYGILHTDCMAYIDDIVVFARSEAEHLEKLARVFERMRKHGLKLKPQKCHLFQEEITYLGHCISKHGVRKDPEKTCKVEDWPVPTCVRDVRRFLGFSSYFRKFIRDYARIAAPLSSLLQGYSTKRTNRRMNKLKEEELWNWSEEHQTSFDRLRQLLVDDVTLAFADFEKEFVLEVDACKTGFGAVLYQMDDKKKRPLCYASRKTSRTEQGYSTHKLEFCALRWAVCDKFREYLCNGNRCMVYTDNNPLKHILTKAKIDATSQRWCSDLADFNLTVNYKSGVSNVAADALSRLHEDDNQLDDANCYHKWCKDISRPVQCIQNKDVHAILSGCSSDDQSHMDAIIAADLDLEHTTPIPYRVASIQNLRITKNWAVIQNKDSNIRIVKNIIRDNKGLTKHQYRLLETGVKAILRRRKDLYIDKDILKVKNMNGDRIVVNQDELPILMKCYHEGQGHLGEDRTINLIESRFFYPKMRMSIVEAVKMCNRCTLRKTLPAKNRTTMGHLRVPEHPFDIVSMDHVSIDNRATGTHKVLTVVDHFTKYAFLLHVNNERANTTAKKLMEEVFLKFSFPNFIHSDNGSAFVNSVMKELTEMCGMTHTKSLPYTPQGNAICERMNQTLLDMLGTLDEVKKKNWKNHLSSVQYAYNTTMHATTGYAPFYLLFGRHPRLVGDIILGIDRDHTYKNEYITEVRKSLQSAYQKCKQSLLKHNERHKRYYDSKLIPVMRKLQLGDIVVTRKMILTSKIDNRWNGEPHKVVGIPVDDIPVYQVKNCETGKITSKHRNSLLPLFGPVIQQDKPNQRNPTTKKDKGLSGTEPHEEEVDDNDSINDIIIDLPLNEHDPEDIAEVPERLEESMDDDLDDQSEEPSRTTSDAESSDDPATPLRRSDREHRPPTRYSPSHYNAITMTTRL